MAVFDDLAVADVRAGAAGRPLTVDEVAGRASGPVSRFWFAAQVLSFGRRVQGQLVGACALLDVSQGVATGLQKLQVSPLPRGRPCPTGRRPARSQTCEQAGAKSRVGRVGSKFVAGSVRRTPMYE